MHDYPRKIIVFRHAEEPAHENDQRLSPIGRGRAGYLATYIPRNFGKPDYIFACKPTRQGLHPLLTVLPLFESLEGVPLNVFCPHDFHALIARSIIHGSGMPSGKYAGRNIVICWHHSKIPALLASLGAEPGKYPDPWPDDDFGSVYVLARDNDRVITTRYEMMF
ncbi:hypothetical protein [Paraburkholderia adhaesiva]|uniref:hypothetical protein n=1 Tax=Paraburkholderia adhaesiva TaxID=2883244 RepID=UPI001F20182A|nr:hypothetical protein [Paraburkholderia adhaesiva]